MRRWIVPVSLLMLVAALTLLLGGCCAGNLKLKSCPSKFKLEIAAAQDLNSCTEQGSYRVKLKVYSLTRSGALQAAEFKTLWNDEANDLGGAVLDVQEVTLEPGQSLRHEWERPEGTRAVGVVANFCQLDSGCWLKVLEVGDGSRTFDLGLQGTCLTMTERN